MGRAAVVAIMLGCAACGRYGFDLHDDGSISGATDGRARDGQGDGVIGSDMVPISTGPITFMMGCNAAADTACSGDESPYHMVTLSPYEIDRTEVTQASYAACVSAGVCALPQSCGGSTYDPVMFPNAPVTCIRIFDAQEYCQWRSARLPTEAEWELAARGTDGRVYPWGNQPADCTRANTTVCPDQNVHDVGSHPTGASPYGLEDMAGNAWEIVSDIYDANYYANSPIMDPLGSASGTMGSERGGGFFDPTDELRASNRRAVNNLVNPDRGMRCARSL